MRFAVFSFLCLGLSVLAPLPAVFTSVSRYVSRSLFFGNAERSCLRVVVRPQRTRAEAGFRMWAVAQSQCRRVKFQMSAVAQSLCRWVWGVVFYFFVSWNFGWIQILAYTSQSLSGVL